MTTAARMRVALLATALAVLPLAARADGPPERRYVAKSGAFSIAMDDLAARLMTTGAEQVSGDTIVVDFSTQPIAASSGTARAGWSMPFRQKGP